jgi:5-methyltetrahydropteroyltriglutamate--homocysteine methyltransferase
MADRLAAVVWREPMLVTHVGSLVRPPELVKLLRQSLDGPVDQAVLSRSLDEAVREIVKQQIDIGIEIVSDGEFGKSISWSRYVLERLAGFEHKSEQKTVGMPKGVQGKDRRDFAEFYGEYDVTQGFVGMSGWVVTGPIKYVDGAIKQDLDRLKKALKGKAATGFVPAVSPVSVAPDRQDEYYKTNEEYLFAVADAMRDEYKAIIDAGFILQVDDSYMASTYDVMVPPGTLSDFRKWAAVRVEAVNHALRGLPEDRVRYHMCWGSWNGPHTNDLPLKDIVDLLLTIRACGYSLEMANPRHEHEWHVWENVKLPEHKVLLPGVISHATNVVEHPELVAERLLRLARLVGKERVIASTDCGFAQGPFTRRVHPSIMWAKLKALVEGARLASAS